MVFYHPNNDSFLAAWPPVGGILWLGRNEGAELPHLCGRVDSGHAARVDDWIPPRGGAERGGVGRLGTRVASSKSPPGFVGIWETTMFRLCFRVVSSKSPPGLSGGDFEEATQVRWDFVH